MDKQDLKRGAAAAAVGAIGGTAGVIGIDAAVSAHLQTDADDVANDEQSADNDIQEAVQEAHVEHTVIHHHYYDDDVAQVATEPEVSGDGHTPDPQSQHSNDIVNNPGPVTVVVEPVPEPVIDPVPEPEPEPVVIIDPVPDPIIDPEPEPGITVMYGGPVEPDVYYEPEPVIYGGPTMGGYEEDPFDPEDTLLDDPADIGI